MTLPAYLKYGRYDITKVFKEMESDSDRASALAAAAYFESILTMAIAARFVELDNKQLDIIFKDREGAITTLWQKTLIGHAIGLYGPKTLKDLNHVRTIRNHFAHYPEVSEFMHKDVKWRCKELYTAQHVQPTTAKARDQDDPNSPRSMYMRTLLEIGARLMRSGVRQRNHIKPMDTGLY